MSSSVPSSPPLWTGRRLALTGLLMMAACYVAVFVADGGSLSVGIVRDALANTLAGAAAALPVWLLCKRMAWRLAARWWFLPMHLIATAGFALLWYYAIALSLGGVRWLTGGSFAMLFLQGPALHWELMTAFVLYFAVASSCYTVQAIGEAQEAAALLRQSEVSALRAQLDPHLLFNTLHSLLELVRSGDRRADDALDRFARVVRYVTDGRDGGTGLATLDAEWQMAQDYVSLESLRLGERFQCRFSRAPGLGGVRLPAMTLQPLIENAIRHGIAPRPGTGHVRVCAERDGEDVTLLVEDDGLGIAAATPGSGMGLSLVRRRFEATFGSATRFVAAPSPDTTGWRVVVTFPAQHEG